MVIGFTGTRRGPTPRQSDGIRRFVRAVPPSRFVHGGAPGCDTIAHHIVRAACPDICIEIHPSEIHGSTVWMPMGNCEIYPELPPLDRNRVIVSRVYGMLAVPKSSREESRSGTWATVREARRIGCPVIIIRPDGEIIGEWR